MTLATLAARNLLWNRFRTTLTVVGVAMAVVTFVALRTVISAWTVGAEYASRDRIATRHKVTFVMTLPRRYVDDIRAVPGVTAATWANWFGARNPRRPREFFMTLAVDGPSFLEVYDEISLSPEARQAWMADRRGALVGAVLAKKFGYRVGDRVTLAGTIFPGDWEFRVSGIYRATRRSMDESSFFFHWDYLNESIPEARRNQVGWMLSRVDDPRRSTAVSAEIDRIFDTRDTQTITMSERAMGMSFIAGFSAVLGAIDVVSLAILLIMMLILGNTIAMGVRERTSEYGAMRAIGFQPRHIASFVVGEGMFIGALGGAVGLALSFLIVQTVIGRLVEENLGSLFPYFRISGVTALAAVVLAVALGAVAAVVPAYQASRLNVIEALRRVG